MVNTNHDVGSYESSGYEHVTPLFDCNLLYEGFQKAKKNSDWKTDVQRFEVNLLTEIVKLKKELVEGNFNLSPTKEFKINERGHTRIITGDSIRDRVVKHVLCDNILTPAIEKYLIYDNGASIKGKGISFARNRLLTHLRRYYRENGGNDGYILLIDYSKYYDNIRHEDLMNMFRKYIKDDVALSLIEKILNAAAIDVSYMSEEEYKNCMKELFNSIDYFKLDKSNFIGRKFMPKHLNIGDQVSQISGIMYPMQIDNYVKIVKSMKYYGRYMDDSYVISNNKEKLISLLEEIKEKAKDFGIFINIKKTRICKLSDYWRFLQIQYSLTSSGRIIQKINPKRLTSMRRKMKKLIGKISAEEYVNWFKAWYNNYMQIMSKQQKDNIIDLVFDLLSKKLNSKEKAKWLIKNKILNN